MWCGKRVPEMLQAVFTNEPNCKCVHGYSYRCLNKIILSQAYRLRW